MRVHVSSCLDSRSFQCTICEKRFNSRTALNSHAKVHETAMTYTCEYCGKAFKRLGGMKNHMAIHLNEKRFKCIVCGKGHNTSSGLSMHMKMHLTVKNYACEICGNTYKRQHSMKNHMATHLDERWFQCAVCGKGFNTCSMLCSHRKHCTSSGQQCPICNAVITGGKRVFKKHVNSHPIDYNCEICGKIFKRKEHLKRHRAIHLNQREHVCAMCDKAFNTSSQLSTHRNRVHKLTAGNVHNLMAINAAANLQHIQNL